MTAHEQLAPRLAPAWPVLSRRPSPLGEWRVLCIVEARYEKQRPDPRDVSWWLLH